MRLTIVSVLILVGSYGVASMLISADRFVWDLKVMNPRCELVSTWECGDKGNTLDKLPLRSENDNIGELPHVIEETLFKAQ